MPACGSWSPLQELFSPFTAFEHHEGEAADESLLWPEEDAVLGRVAAGRRRDFVAGRRCARLAMEQLGIGPSPVLRGPKREPLWPAGVVGAITHTAGFAAAVVARAGDVSSLGVDVEPNEPLPAGVLDRVAREEELAWAGRSSIAGLAHPDRLLFCVKEAIYKAWFPLAGAWLGFGDASVRLDPEGRSIRASILVDGPLQTVTGRYAVVGGYVVAGVEVPAASRQGAIADQGP